MATINNDQWIQGAIKNPGSLHQMLGLSVNTNIPQKRIVKAAQSSDPLLAKRARLALTLSRLNRSGRKG